MSILQGAQLASAGKTIQISSQDQSESKKGRKENGLVELTKKFIELLKKA